MKGVTDHEVSHASRDLANDVRDSLPSPRPRRCEMNRLLYSVSNLSKNISVSGCDVFAMF